MLSDHQETDSFSYNRTWDDFQTMLEKAEQKQNMHFTKMHQKQSREDRIYHMRNFKALEGVIKTLRWAMGDVRIEHPLE